jgi:hypothetical protein
VNAAATKSLAFIASLHSTGDTTDFIASGEEIAPWAVAHSYPACARLEEYHDIEKRKSQVAVEDHEAKPHREVLSGDARRRPQTTSDGMAAKAERSFRPLQTSLNG